MQRSFWKSVCRSDAQHISQAYKAYQAVFECGTGMPFGQVLNGIGASLPTLFRKLPIEFSYCQELMSWYTQKMRPPTSFQQLLFQQDSVRLPFTRFPKRKSMLFLVQWFSATGQWQPNLPHFSECRYESAFLESSEIISFVIFIYRVESGHPAPPPKAFGTFLAQSNVSALQCDVMPMYYGVLKWRSMGPTSSSQEANLPSKLLTFRLETFSDPCLV